MQKIRLAVVGTGQRGLAYVKLIQANPDVQLTAICDSDGERLTAFAEDLACRCGLMTTDAAAVAAAESVDAILITVPDRWHRDVAVQCLAAGKDVVLEKPLALTADHCRDIILAQRSSGRVAKIGFVLRCTPFYNTVKSIVDSGCLGQIMSLSASEFMGVKHSASYMRRWHRRTANSGSFLLAKCSHDLDLLCWLTGSRPVWVASFGDNNFFRPQKAPATHCSKCPRKEQCPFALAMDKSFVYMTPADRQDPSRRDFDLCVYNEDKDIVDNQVTILEFANGVRATFSLQLFAPVGTRGILITGSEGFLEGDFTKGIITVTGSRDGQSRRYDVSVTDDTGHGNGDEAFLRAFVQAVRRREASDADLLAGMAATVIGVAIESARQERRVVEIDPRQYEF